MVPWSVFWDQNYFAHAVPIVGDVITNNFVRGAVSGLGLINIAVGTRELIAMLLARRADPTITSLHTTGSSGE